MKQSKIESFIESFIDVLIGLVVAVLLWMFIIPDIWLTKQLIHAILITSTFTLASIIRKYIVRRFFENKLHRRIRNVINWYMWNKTIR